MTVITDGDHSDGQQDGISLFGKITNNQTAFRYLLGYNKV